MPSSNPDVEIVAAYLRGLPAPPLPEALANPDSILLRARLLAKLSSTRAADRGERPLWAAGFGGTAAAGLALLALFARSASSLEAARDRLGLVAASGLPQLIAIAVAAGVVLAAAIVLPLVLVEE
jgi:hypothetical protein